MNAVRRRQHCRRNYTGKSFAASSGIGFKDFCAGFSVTNGNPIQILTNAAPGGTGF
jgi:hypothetical protein